MCNNSDKPVLASDVAKYIIGLMPVDNLKLQKLLYYSQAVHLVRMEALLFSDEIQAWRYGPVIPNVYRIYKDFGFEIIKSNDDDHTDKQLTDGQLKSIDMALEYYGEMSSIRLVNETHSEDPWKNVYDENKRDIVITTESMFNYYKDVLEIS